VPSSILHDQKLREYIANCHFISTTIKGTSLGGKICSVTDHGIRTGTETRFTGTGSGLSFAGPDKSRTAACGNGREQEWKTSPIQHSSSSTIASDMFFRFADCLLGC